MITRIPTHRVLLLLLLLVFAVADNVSAWTGQVVSVTDGDTIKVLDPGGQQVKIRLYGIDSPEKKQSFGQAATKHTADMIAGKAVEIEEVDRDRYGRTVGIVLIGGMNVNQELVKNGYAWVYHQYCRRPECRNWQSLEREAQAKKIGLWVEPEPIPPWDWRRTKKTGQ
jgi:endonuclease YncB( thermonuclease family)